MTMKKFLMMLLAATFVLALACGKGKEPAKEKGEDDEDVQQTASTTAATGAPAAAATSTAAAAAPVSPDAATITGAIKLDGAAPKEPVIQMAADPYCQSQHSTPVMDEEVVADGTGALANVFVYVENVAGNFPAPSTPVVLDQKGCQYHPHVNAVMVGQPLEIKNDDATLHNVHAMPNVNSQFNVGQPVQGMTENHKFDKAEVTPFKIKCDVHGWMKSYMAVMPHPFYAVSQANGQFTINNLPPGNYTLVAWHEKYGTQKQQVTVGAKESKTVTFNFKG